MSEAKLRSVERYFKEVFAGLDLDVVEELLTPDIVARAPGVPPLTGIESFKTFLRAIGTSFPERRVEVGPSAVKGDHAFGVFTIYQRHLGEFRGIAPTGNEVQVTGVNLFRFTGERISEVTVWYNPLDLLEQIGAGPEATAYGSG